MPARLNKMYLILGVKGSGKTFYMINDDPAEGPIGIVQHYLKTRPAGRVLIIDTIDHPDYAKKGYKIIHQRYLKAWEKGIKRIIINTPYEFLELCTALESEFSNGMIIMEDSQKYIPKKRPVPEDLSKAIINIKQKNVDIFFMYHGFRFSHPDIWGFADRLQLFNTPDSPEIREPVINEYEAVEAGYKRVQQNKLANKHYSESIVLI